MKNYFKNLHVLTSISLSLMLLIITFSTNSPLILACVLLTCILIFVSTKNLKKLKQGLIVFIPFSIITVIINILFVQQGKIVLFSIGNRSFTLEALIYAVMLSLKLLIVVYVFSFFSIIVDSDRAAAYFSSVSPKTTLTLMIALKLFPIMKKRLTALREIYSIRGLDFEGKGIRNKLQSFMPVLSILLEDSLEKSFDIGEAVYVRGFLSTKRSIYDRQRYKSYDYIIIFTCVAITLVYLVFSVLGLESYDLYGFDIKTFLFNKPGIVIAVLFIFLYIELLVLLRKLVVTYEVH